MIVTRRRRKPFPWRRFLIPLVLSALAIGALEWPPSQHWIVFGPLAGVWRSSAPVWRPLAAPFVAFDEEHAMARQSAEISQLQAQLAKAQVQADHRAQQMSAMQSHINRLQVKAAAQRGATARRVGTVRPVPAPSASALPFANDLSAGATPDMRRTAAVWEAMDPSAAAKVVQRLPIEYVARVFALMSPDAVGSILENVPPKYAAQLTQERPALTQ